MVLSCTADGLPGASPAEEQVSGESVQAFRKPARSNDAAGTPHVNGLELSVAVIATCLRPSYHPTMIGPSNFRTAGTAHRAGVSSSPAAPKSSLPRHDTCGLFSRCRGPHHGMDHEAWLALVASKAECMDSAALGDHARVGQPQTASHAKAEALNCCKFRTSRGLWGPERQLHFGEPLPLATSLHWMGPKRPVALPRPPPPPRRS